jgi:hypothetical protein
MSEAPKQISEYTKSPLERTFLSTIISIDRRKSRGSSTGVSVGRSSGSRARSFLHNLAARVSSLIQISTDAFTAYPQAIESAFPDADYGQVIKVFGAAPDPFKGRYSPAACVGARNVPMRGNPDPASICTSHSERNNLNVRMHNRRMTRLTNALSKKVENHAHAMALHFLYYNFVRIHQTLKVTPAMAAGVTKRLWEMRDVVEMLEAWEAAQ